MGTSSNTTTPTPSSHYTYSTHLSLKGRIAFTSFLALFALAFLLICCRAARLSRRRRSHAPSCTASDPSAASAEALRALPVFVRAASDGKEECSVCLEGLKQGDSCKRLPTCAHAFHARCIDAWLRSHSTCPLCRSLVGSEPPASSTAIV